MTLLDFVSIIGFFVLAGLLFVYPRQVMALFFLIGILTSVIWLIIEIGLETLVLFLVACAIGLALAYGITRIPVLLAHEIEKQAKK